MTFEIKTGIEVTFEDTEGLDRINVVRQGVVNGDPIVFDDRTLIPVHVQDGNLNIMVDSRNLVAAS